MVKSVQRVAVLGAGVMGSTIAGLLAGAGAQVLMLDIVPPELSDEDKAKGLTKESPAFRNKLADEGIKRLQDKRTGMLFSKNQLPYIETGNLEDDIERLAECDWILEVVVERLDIKQSVMKQIAKYRRKGSIVSSNTSGISINAIADGQDKEFRQHFLGTHFFNPPRFMHLFELIPCSDTLPEVMEEMARFGETKLGKGIVFAKDTPNFIGNRIGTYASVKTFNLMLEYGFDIPTIDQLTGPVMGHPKSATFRTGDMVGLDVLSNVAGNVSEDKNLSDEERARFEMPQFVKDLVEMGSLGDKTRKGFYQRKRGEDGKRIFLVYDVDKKDYVEFDRPKFSEVGEAMRSDNKYAAFVEGDTKFHEFAWELQRDIMLYAAEMVPEITEDYTMIDKAMNWGYNWEAGPFQTWDAIGVEKVIERAQKDGCTIPAWVLERVESGKKTFYEPDYKSIPYIEINDTEMPILKGNEDAQIRDMGDGVLFFEFISMGNSISQKTMEVFDMAFEELDAKDYRGMVIGNNGNNFSVGANVVEIAFGMQEKEWGQIEAGVKKYQDTNMAMKYSRKPIVAAPHNQILGGGCEIVMHANAVTPCVESYIGLVEVGVGLLPGAGGNKELLIRYNEQVNGTDNNDMLKALIGAFQAIATATVATNGFDAIDKNYMNAKNTKVIMNPNARFEEGKKKVLQLDADGYMPPAKAQVKVLGDFGRGALAVGLNDMLVGNFVSEYDKHIASKIAWVLTGGNVVPGTIVSEQYLLDLEREAFLSLCGEDKTMARIEHMMVEGKPLRN